MADVKTVRLRNKTTGVVVEVREDKVDALALDWEAADKAPRQSRASKSDTK